MLIRVLTTDFQGAFHHAKNLENFVQKSNGMVHFGSVQPECSGPLFEVVHFDQSDWSDRNLPFHFDKQVHCPTSLEWISLK